MLAAVSLGLVVLVQIRVQRQGGVRPGSYHLLAYILGWQAIALLAATLLRWTRPRNVAVGLVLAGVVALPLVSLTRPAQISDDLYRYAWDGRVQAAGIDPYRYAPNADELSGFRDAWLWPDAHTCVRLGKKVDTASPLHACTRINRPAVPTIYPPVAEGYFWLADALPGASRDHRLQVDAAILSASLTGLLALGLRRYGRDPLLVAYYSFGPLAGLDIAGDAHVDVLAALFAVGAVLAATLRPRSTALAGVLVGLAVAVKLYPVLLLPALMRRDTRRYGAMRLVAVAAGTIALTYLPHVIAVGPRVFGYLPGYLHEENYESGSRFLLLGLLGLGGTVTKILAVGAVAAAASIVGRRCWQGRLSPAAGGLTMFGTAFLIATPSQPWYGLLLVCLSLLTGRLEWLAAAVATYPLYVTAVIHADTLLAGRLSYSLAAIVVIGVSLVRMSRQPRSGSVTNSPIPSSKVTVGAQLSSARARDESAVM